MTRKNKETLSKVIPEFNFPSYKELERIRKKLSNPNYESGNIVLAEDAPTEEKMKYSFCQSILTYHQEKKASLELMAQIIGITQKKLYDICRGKLTDFCLGELVIYANNLDISFVACWECKKNIFPLLWKAVISSLKLQESFPTNDPNIHQAIEKHQVAVH